MLSNPRRRNEGVYVTVDIEGHIWAFFGPAAERLTPRECTAWGGSVKEAYDVAKRRLGHYRDKFKGESKITPKEV